MAVKKLEDQSKIKLDIYIHHKSRLQTDDILKQDKISSGLIYKIRPEFAATEKINSNKVRNS